MLHATQLNCTCRPQQQSIPYSFCNSSLIRKKQRLDSALAEVYSVCSRVFTSSWKLYEELYINKTELTRLQYLNGCQNGGNIVRWTPAVLQDVKTDTAICIDYKTSHIHQQIYINFCIDSLLVRYKTVWDH